MRRKLVIVVMAVVFAACIHPGNEIKLIPSEKFESTIDGKQVQLFTLQNENGLTTQITNLGGRVVSLWVPDKKGHYDDIVLGVETADQYLTVKEKYLGATAGRYANRIAKGSFILEGDTFKLACNNGENHLHGGIKGLNNVVWNARLLNNQSLELTYLSAHMEEGYPGNLQIKMVYELTNANELKIEYWATTDKATHVNLTHHSFFNLHGAGKGSINDHVLYINADQYTPVDEGLIPTGEIDSVAGTPFDFRHPTIIGERLNDDFQQLLFGKGYDHNWVLNRADQHIKLAGRVSEPHSGRVMEVYTNEAGIQFYGGNFLDGSIMGKQGIPYEYRSAFCLETQHFPDSPNQPHFPSTLLHPGETYQSICIYKFLVK